MDTTDKEAPLDPGDPQKQDCFSLYPPVAQAKTDIKL